jgi:plasmid stabilization system protein ParE
MRYHVVISEAAWADLLTIATRIAATSPRAADTLVTEIHQTCLSLGSFPTSHPLIADPKKRGVRRAIHGNYLIFFRPREAEVEVVHVIHGARDYHRLLFPEDER